MHILVTNDDGIESPGLWILAAALRDSGLGLVTVVAPDTEYSGYSMSLPPREEHLIEQVAPPDESYEGITAYALAGTPVNCVTSAMLGLAGARPDLVVSGINRGLNTGTNVMLSGTVGAAMMATLWGVPGLAVSAHFVRDHPLAWHEAAQAAVRTLPLLEGTRRSANTDQHIVLNVNVPNVSAQGPLKGYRQTRLSEFFYGWFIGVEELGHDSQGRRRFQYNFDRNRRQVEFDEDSDNGAIAAGYISVTPLTPMGSHNHVNIGAALAALELP